MEKLFENLGLVKQPQLHNSNPKRGAYSAPYEPPAARTNVLTYVGLWPMSIKLNPT